MWRGNVILWEIIFNGDVSKEEFVDIIIKKLLEIFLLSILYVYKVVGDLF